MKLISFVVRRQWLIDAYNHYKAIQQSNEAANAGVQEVSGYVFSAKFPEITKVQKQTNDINKHSVYKKFNLI